MCALCRACIFMFASWQYESYKKKLDCMWAIKARLYVGYKRDLRHEFQRDQLVSVRCGKQSIMSTSRLFNVSWETF